VDDLKTEKTVFQNAAPAGRLEISKVYGGNLDFIRPAVYNYTDRNYRKGEGKC